jgi:hypothetical protein
MDSIGSIGLSTTGSVSQATYDYSGVFALAAYRFNGYDNLPAVGAPFFPTPSTGFPAAQLGRTNTASLVFQDFRTPYSLQFDLSYQRELPKGVIFEVSYVGRQGRLLAGKSDMAQWWDHVDPVSGQSLFEALNVLESRINALGTSPDPASCTSANLFSPTSPCATPIPYFENVMVGLPVVTKAVFFGPNPAPPMNSTQAMAAWVLSSFGNNYAGLTVFLDKTLPNPNGTYVPTYGPFTPSGLLSPYTIDGGASPGNFFDPEGDGHVWTQQQYTILPVWTNWATSAYNGMVVSVRRRMGSFQFDANYTLSNSIDDVSQIEGTGLSEGIFPLAWDRRSGRAFSSFDQRHNFNANWYYELPFGRGKTYLSKQPDWADHLLGGWQVTGVWRWRSGFPLTVEQGSPAWVTNWNSWGFATQKSPVSTNISRDAAGGPNLFPNAIDTSAPDPAFAEGTAFAAFRLTLPGGTGNRSSLRGPAFFAVDLGLGKSFRLPWEGHRLQFRWETFNLFNNVNFSTGGINLNVAAQNPAFGRLTATAPTASQSSPIVPHNRVMQFGLRYEF